MRRNGWESALRRIAARSKCYMYVRSDTEQMIECRPGEKTPGPNGAISYFVALGYIVSKNIAYPMMSRLKYGTCQDGFHRKWKDSEGKMQLLARRNFYEITGGESKKSLEEACQKFLEANTGFTLGISLVKKPNPRTGYSEEVFLPVAEIPGFGSLQELNLKLDSMGA